MKKLSFYILAAIISAGLFIAGCTEGNGPDPDNQSILPEAFGVDIPGALSAVDAKKSASEIDTIKGNDVYEHLRTFIHVGDFAAELVEAILTGISTYQINKAMSLSYESDDDGRVKNLVVVENAEFDGANWEFQLTVTDADSEGNDDGGKAMQIFWNQEPVKGISILKPYNIDRTNDADMPDAIFRIDYNSDAKPFYDASMMVYVAGLPLASPLEDPYSMKTLKLFAGKDGDIIDVYGNSDHPNAILIAGNTGFNWAFVASGDEVNDIGVAEVGLPPSNLDEPSREKLLDYYGIGNVFAREIMAVWPGVPQTTVDAYLANTEAPGYFDRFGFVSAGVSPGSDYDNLDIRLDDLSPYNPKEIGNMTITFK